MASYSFPQDDYALTLLTQAAMNSRPIDPNGYEHQASASGSTADSPSEISNRQRDVGRILFDTNTAPHHSFSNLSNSYVASVLSTTNMATLAFGSTAGNGREPFMDSAFRGGIRSQISRNYPNSLEILNAETYGSGLLGRNSSNSDPRKQSNDSTIPFGLLDTSLSRLERDAEPREDIQEIPEPEPESKRKKKRRVEAISAEEDDDDDAKKKSRGRPRVDTKDETAADRRRTQIRMAQRAYRNRKETTISSLEKKVQDLRGTNEEMNNIFISLYDFAVGRGLLQREPEFGRQLQYTAERFLSLAKASSEDMGDDHSELPEKVDPVSEKQEAGPPKKKGKRVSPKNRRESTPPASAPIPSPTVPTWGGYQINQSKDQFEELETDFHLQPFEQRTRDLQVITRPTEDNASFPFDFSDDLQNYRVELPADEGFSQFFLPGAQPPLPESYSYTEFSFGRRLLRASLERAMALLTMENPPEDIFRRAFGFSLQYETKEAILARVRRVLARPPRSSLQNWSAPFVHVGGAGTFYPLPGDINEDLMPPFGSGFSQKPYPQRITEIEEFMDTDMKCSKAGFKGEFFDANDVEGYLRSRGLEIPGSADTVTAQIDLSVISDAATPKSLSDASSTMSPITPQSTVQLVPDEPDIFEALYSLEGENLDHEAYPFPLASPKWTPTTVATKNSNIEPSFFSVAGQAFNTTSTRESDRPTITLNVQTLLSEIISRAVCLGRGPGYRPADVNAAIISAVRAP